MKVNKILSVIISAAMAFTLTGNLFIADAQTSQSTNQETSVSNDVSFTGTNSVGEMLADALSDETDEQQQADGNVIYSVEIENNVAKVEYSVAKDCTLVVAVYDEDGKQMKTSGNAQVSAEENTANIAFDGASMPEYFYIKAYLIDSVTMRPLGMAYDCPNYTKEMQEFLAKTSDDFDEARVLNLDDDNTKNFAVYNENVVVIPETEGINTLTDNGDGSYTVENADESFTSLNAGDIFAYEKADGEVLIVIVKTIEVNGDIVTIVEDDAELEDIFEYFRIESEMGYNDLTYEAPEGDDEFVFEEICAPSEEQVSGSEEELGAISDEIVISGAELKFSIYKKEGTADDTKGSFNINGKFKLTPKLKFYISKSYSYFEARLDWSLGGEVTLSGTIDSSKKLGNFVFSPVVGLYISCTPSFVFEFTATATFTLQASGTLGVRVSSEGDNANLNSSPKIQVSLELSGTVFFGISMKPEITIIHKKIANASMEAKTGIELTLKDTLLDSNEHTSDAVIHSCKKCYGGTINWKTSLSVQVTFLNSKRLTFKHTLLEYVLKINDIYHSYDYNEYGMSVCPHKDYKVTMTVTDSDKKPIAGAVVEEGLFTYTTDEKGMVSFYKPTGLYFVKITMSGFDTVNSRLTVADAPKSTSYIMGGGANINAPNSGKNYNTIDVIQEYCNGFSILTKDGTYYSIESVTNPIVKRTDIKQIFACCALTKDGTVLTWDYYADLDTAKPIMNNCSKIACGGRSSGLVWAALTNDGKVYVWGESNRYGMLGPNVPVYSRTDKPVFVIDDIVDIKITDDTVLALKSNGDLYYWGSPISSSIYYQLSPKLIASNIVEFDKDAIVDKNGNLRFWTSKYAGKYGGGIVLRDVKKVYFDSSAQEYFALTKKNELYGWEGYTDTSSNTYKYRLKLLLTDVRSFSCESYNRAAVTTDGSLYTWGKNDFGQLGNGTRSVECPYPKHIRDNVEHATMSYSRMGFKTKDNKYYICGCENSTFSRYWLSPLQVAIPEENVTLTADYESLASTAFTSAYLPYETYNIYGMKDRSAADPFGTDNLLYIMQAQTDENGVLVYEYLPAADSPNPEIFVKAMTGFDVENARIVKAEAGERSVSLEWTANNADYYTVYSVRDGICVKETDTQDNTYTVGGLTNDIVYGFIVQSHVNGEESVLDDEDIVYAVPYIDLAVVSQPTDVTAAEGIDASFTIEATGNVLSYQWQENDGTGWKDIADATTPVLVLDKVTKAMNGKMYRCFVYSNDSYVISETAVLTVVPADKVTEEMVSEDNMTIQQCINFVNYFTDNSDSDTIKLTSAQLIAIERALEYDKAA